MPKPEIPTELMGDAVIRFIEGNPSPTIIRDYRAMGFQVTAIKPWFHKPDVIRYVCDKLGLKTQEDYARQLRVANARNSARAVLYYLSDPDVTQSDAANRYLGNRNQSIRHLLDDPQVVELACREGWRTEPELFATWERKVEDAQRRARRALSDGRYL